MAIAACAVASAAEPPAKVLAVSSYDAAPYKLAVGGLRRVFAANGLAGGLRTFSLETEGQAAANALRIPGAPPLVVAFGARAVRFARALGEGGPVLACLTLDAAGLPGVVLRHDPEVQIEWLHRFLPNARAIGVLHGASQTRDSLKRFASAVKKAGMKLVMRRISNEKDLDDLLPILADEIDALLATHDPGLLTPQAARQLLVFSFQNRIPLVGLSDAWAKAGALYALDWDYEDLGQQCGEAAIRVLRGAAAAGLGTVPPRKVVYSVNLRTALFLKLAIPQELTRGARNLYE